MTVLNSKVNGTGVGYRHQFPYFYPIPWLKKAGLKNYLQSIRDSKDMSAINY